MLYAPLTITTAKLDVRFLLKPSPSPPPSSPTSLRPPISRSLSVPVPNAALSGDPSASDRTSTLSDVFSITTHAPTSSVTSQTSSQYRVRKQPVSPRLLIPSPLNQTPTTQDDSNPNPNKRPRLDSDQVTASASPAKKQSKWSPEEDALIIELRGSGMKWEDISKRLPGRSAISCRLHYQNYLERRSEWDEERKNRLARLYERLKPDMWAPLAAELGIPWRAAEAMHWQLGETDMARRAGVVPFSFAAVSGPPSSMGFDTNVPSSAIAVGQQQLPPQLHQVPGGTSNSPLSAYGADRTATGSSLGEVMAGMVPIQPRIIRRGSMSASTRERERGRERARERERPRSVLLPSVAELERGLTAHSGVYGGGYVPEIVGHGNGHARGKSAEEIEVSRAQ